MIDELRKKAEVIGKELEDVRRTISETDEARRKNYGAYSKERSLSRKYWKIKEEIEHPILIMDGPPRLSLSLQEKIDKAYGDNPIK